MTITTTTTADVSITELEEFEPSRVDGVKSAANGFPILMLKSIDGEVTETEATIDDVLAELDKAAEADDDRPKCKTCSGAGKIKDGAVKCPDCFGSGMAPRVGETAKEFLTAVKEAGVAASGQPTPPAEKCPTCNGSGTLRDGGAECPDCNGSGRDSTMPPEDKLNREDGFAGRIDHGDPQHREAVDKELADRYPITEDEYVAKRDMDANVGGGVDRDKLPAGDFAGKNRSFPIVTPGDVSDAASSIGRAGSDNYSAEQLRANITRIARRKGASFVAQLPKSWTDDAEKAMDSGMFSAPNAQLATVAAPGSDGSSGTDDGSEDDASAPGSPAWEGIDAETASAAAVALMTAAELIRRFAQREAIEVAAGEGNDVFDTFAAEQALCGVSSALGIMAALAFHEGLEAQKSVAEKSGKRLSSRSVGALAAARDHISALLGDDDPAKKESNDDDESAKGATSRYIDNANKALLAKEIEDMSTDELAKLLDERDERLVGVLVEALKGKSAMDEADSVSNAKTVRGKAKSKRPKDDDMDLEDEADQGDNDSASSPAMGAAKAEAEDELTPEEIDAKKARKEAKQALRVAEEAEKQAATNAATAKAIEEAVAKATEAVTSLQERLAAAEKATEDRLATVEKMAAPSTIVRTSPPDALHKSAERDAIDLEITKLEQLARDTPEQELRRGYTQAAKELRVRLAEASKDNK